MRFYRVRDKFLYVSENWIYITYLKSSTFHYSFPHFRSKWRSIPRGMHLIYNKVVFIKH